jgi:hypothetical protein
MKKYHKIQSIFKRDETTHKFIIGNYSRPEFEYLKNNKWIWTEKIDGTNIRVNWDLEKVTIGGKTDKAQLHKDLIKNISDMFPVDKFKKLYPGTSMTLYGEGCGTGIQKGGGNYSSIKTFILFDILIDEFWLLRKDVIDIANKLEIKSVPIVGDGTIQEAIDFVRNDFNKSEFGDFQAEGVVLRPEAELFARNGQRIITKVKYKDFN